MEWRLFPCRRSAASFSSDFNFDLSVNSHPFLLQPLVRERGRKGGRDVSNIFNWKVVIEGVPGAARRNYRMFIFYVDTPEKGRDKKRVRTSCMADKRRKQQVQFAPLKLHRTVCTQLNVVLCCSFHPPQIDGVAKGTRSNFIAFCN